MFGTKQALFDAKIEIATLKIELDATKRELDALRPYKDMLQDEVHELRRTREELATKNAVLTERLDLVSNYLPTGNPKATVWPEEAEDAQFALDNGLIDPVEFESILASAGAINTEVAFDGSDYPRIGA